MKIGIGSDHAGFELKEAIKTYLSQEFPAHEVIDFGVADKTSVDYPVYGVKVAEAIVQGVVERGILVCGTGIGISIAANRFKGIRAALCHDAFTAQMCRAHNNANILALGANTTGKLVALDIVKIWLETAFEGGRHERRVTQLDTLIP